MLVAIKKIMSRQFPEAEVFKELGATILCHDIRHSYHDKNKTVGLKLCPNIFKVYRDRIQEKAQRTGRDIILKAAIEAYDKDQRLCRDKTFYVVIERPIYARNLGIHNNFLKCGPTLESL